MSLPTACFSKQSSPPKTRVLLQNPVLETKTGFCRAKTTPTFFMGFRRLFINGFFDRYDGRHKYMLKDVRQKVAEAPVLCSRPTSFRVLVAKGRSWGGVQDKCSVCERLHDAILERTRQTQCCPNKTGFVTYTDSRLSTDSWLPLMYSKTFGGCSGSRAAVVVAVIGAVGPGTCSVGAMHCGCFQHLSNVFLGVGCWLFDLGLGCDQRPGEDSEGSEIWLGSPGPSVGGLRSSGYLIGSFFCMGILLFGD